MLKARVMLVGVLYLCSADPSEPDTSLADDCLAHPAPQHRQETALTIAGLPCAAVELPRHDSCVELLADLKGYGGRLKYVSA